MSQAGRLRLIRRLRNIKGEEITRFWDELFSPTGLFKDLQTALSNGYLLHLIAGAVPEKVSQLIGEGLGSMSLVDRLNIKGGVRRDLMWTLEDLSFRKKTSKAALHCLALLAEAETENYGNNATGVFCECFHPQHPQFPLPLEDRFNFLKELFSPRSSLELRLIGIKAIQTSLDRWGAVSLRRSIGPEPLDARPTLTWGEVWNYIEELMDLLMVLAKSKDHEISKRALDALPHAIAECAIQGRPEAAIERFQTVTEWVLLYNVPIPISQLVEGLGLVQDIFRERRDQGNGESVTRLEESLEKIESLLSRLDKSDFRNRLKRWAGEWTRSDDEIESVEGEKKIYRHEKELRGLAEEAVCNPESLSTDILDWLCSDEAKKAYVFFWWLGRVDSERKLLLKIREIAQENRGSNAFAAYCGGLSQTDRLFVINWVDELTVERKITAEAIVQATGYLGGDVLGVKRMEKLIQEKRVDPNRVEKVLICGGWIDSLNSDEYLSLLKAIGGSKLENAVAVIDFLGMWLHKERPIEGQLAEFAWQCLEAAPPVTIQDAYDCDKLASKLTQSDAERGFNLLKFLLLQPYERRCWNPINRHGGNRFWNALRKTDRERAIRLVLSLPLEDPLQQFKVSWNLREVIDQENDGDFLIAFALENERQARVVCECITTSQLGFWPIALRIIEQYPKSREIQSALAGGVEQMGMVISGPWSAHLEKCRKEVEHVLNDSTTPVSARTWLKRLESSLRNQMEQELVSEIEEEVNELRHVIEDPASPERLWAIKTLISLRKVDNVLKLISKEDLLAILPNLGLSKTEARLVRKKVKG